ncbi:MAG: T9SS type A sorting domain-containing protein [Bacteroidales bacterium]|jgi:hypothetical protein|nr:T9SS type A sorting domain-containing protein [Bacteroidales bacterium]
MKKLVFTVLTCCFILQAHTQTEFAQIFGKESTQWLIPQQNCLTEDEQGCLTVMDTVSIVGTDNEYKLLETPLFSIGKIRTDEINSKLYFVPQNSTEEIVIMDLNLVVGDEFNLTYIFYNGTEYKKTIIVDSVFVRNGKKHIQFDDLINNHFSGKTKRMFIEGVGPNWGFTYDGFIACKYNDGVQLYSFENEYIKDCCFISTSVHNQIIETDIAIYPNPIQEKVLITIPKTKVGNTKMTIYNGMGEIMLTQTISQTQTIIDVSHFPANAMYYCKFQLPNAVVSKKVLKR